MKYHNITKADMLNGEGLRVVLWLSGCSHKCFGCQNMSTWDYNDGLEFDDDALNEIYNELENDWCSGITLSGGDPLFEKNRVDVEKLVKSLKKDFPNKSIWCYTGYKYEELIDMKDDVVLSILNNINVLLDGKFVLKLCDEKIEYVGSSNQLIIDVKKSLKLNKKVLYKIK